MVNKIVYLVILAITGYLTILFKQDTMQFILAIELVIPIVMWVSLQLMARKIEVEVIGEKQRIDKGQTWEVAVRVKNEGYFPLIAIRADLEYCEVQTKRSHVYRVWGRAQGKNSTDIICKKREEYCGKVRINLKQVKVFDYLHLFSKKIVVPGHVEITVLPNLYMTDVIWNPRMHYNSMETEEYDDSRPGSDVSEIFQIREYQRGDTLQRVHWKLSAREDNLLVKDYSHPLGYLSAIYLDYGVGEKEKITHAMMDRMLEISLSLSFSMLTVGCPHYLVWYDPQGGMQRFGIRLEEDLYLAMEAALQNKTFHENIDWVDLYRQQFPAQLPDVQIVINLKGEFWKKGELIQTFSRTNLKTELEEIGLKI